MGYRSRSPKGCIDWQNSDINGSIECPLNFTISVDWYGGALLKLNSSFNPNIH
jgi:hypothetical protein